MATESQVPGQPDLVSVSTTVEIRADPGTVWEHVIAFPPIESPLSLVFRMGIAFPTSATIDGRDVGAIRRCVFSTGVFVEPITAWGEERRLEFDVVKQPPPLTETSVYSDLEAPHLLHVFVSERGRFLLSPTEHGTVILEGTTWYRQKL